MSALVDVMNFLYDNNRDDLSDKLERNIMLFTEETTDIRKGLKAWKEYANHLEHCVECFEMTPEYCEFGAPLKIDANKYGKEQK